MLTDQLDEKRFKAEEARAKATNLMKSQGLEFIRSIAPTGEDMDVEL